MAKDTRELVYDFNKLVIGDEENKVFVVPMQAKIIKSLIYLKGFIILKEMLGLRW